MKKKLFLLFTAILPMMASAYNAQIGGIYYNFYQITKAAPSMWPTLPPSSMRWQAKAGKRGRNSSAYNTQLT